MGVPQQDVLTAEEDGVEGFHVGGVGLQGEGGVVALEACRVDLPLDCRDALTRREQGPLAGFGSREDERRAEIGDAQPDTGSIGVRQREVANAGKVDLPAAQGIEQAFLVGEGAQRQGFLQGSGQHVEIVGGEPLDTLPGEDHAERAIVVAQDADPQLGCLSQPRLLGLGPAGREDLGGVTAMEGQGQGRLQAQQAEQDQCSKEVHHAIRRDSHPCQVLFKGGHSTGKRL
ncbi:hypothetical protein [Aeromonas taiwanensis]|uniref:hypothetical protein n=1 Tax=Aeromonas taiwanensis TaxID=633417 RepID=UPI003B9FA889